jgi:FMN phosphatase YigB (HAD superfamily)
MAITTLILDLGGVLFHWSPQTRTTISPLTIKRILSSPTWCEYECGRLTQQECYQSVGEQFAMDPAEITAAFLQAQDSLRCDEELVSAIRKIKVESGNTLQVYAMSNVSQPDYEILRARQTDWSIFDRVFTSCAVGERKPNLGFYQHVLDATGAIPENTVFIDDQLDNIISARSIGLRGIIYNNQVQVLRAIRNLIGDPVERGMAFLRENSGKLTSTTSGGVVLEENFSQLLILEATDER